MLLRITNRPLPHILFGLIFLFAGSGATLVVNRCQPDAPCCAPACDSGTHDCCQEVVSAPRVAFKADFSCKMVHVAGMTLANYLVEKEHAPEVNKSSTSGSMLPHVAAFALEHLPSASISILRSASPPAREKYVLNCSFLI
jgi:hypothetical protein